jgi:hypothetical protein
MMCEACEKIFDRSPKRKHPHFLGRYVHHKSADMIEGAAATGCQACSIIWARFTSDDKLQMRTRMLQKYKISSLIRSILLHLRGGLVSLFWWTFSRHFFQPYIKQVHQTDDFSQYGWAADLNKGIVEFLFGHMLGRRCCLLLHLAEVSQRANVKRTSVSNGFAEVLPEIQKFLPYPNPQYKCADELIGDTPVDESMDTPAIWALIES